MNHARADYAYNVFLSYRRCNYWPQYVRETFLPMFEHWLATALGDDDAKIYHDQAIETGEEWPLHLAHGLAHSKVMVCLLTRQYWTSEWCKLELSQMLARRKALTGDSGPPPLVLAVLLHDSEKLHASLASIQRFPLQDCACPWMTPKSEKVALLSDRLKALANDVARAVDLAPGFNPEWSRLTASEFWQLFNRQNKQESPPGLG